MNGNFTNGSLVMRVWRFDGGVELIGKFQYYDHAQMFAQSMVARDNERSANQDAAYFYLAVCDNECAAKAFFDPAALSKAGSK